MNLRSLLFSALLGLLLTASSGAFADPMIYTGDAVRTKSVGPFTAKVYAIRHDMKERPATKSKQAVIDADVDKKFTWRMLRDVDSEDPEGALRGPRAERLHRRRPHRPVRRRVQQGGGQGELGGRHQLQRDGEERDDLGAGRRLRDDRRSGLHEGRLEHLARKIDQPAMGDQLISKL